MAVAGAASDDYVAGLWHHDRVGRRLKLFAFVHDVTCDASMPVTEVATGTHDLHYFRTDSFYASRFEDGYVRENYDVIRACGPRGGGVLFDTHSVHRAAPGGPEERVAIVAEYHAAGKCAALDVFGLGLPCPSGDQYLV